MKATNNITHNIMKSLIIIVSVFFIHISTVLAGNNTYSPSAASTVNNLIQSLAPANVETCDFNDAELNAADFSYLAPLVPSEADFNHTPVITYTMASLAPVIPSEADFNDADLENFNITSLAPITPVEADFND